MEIFVSELPKCCGECFCNDENTWCGASDGTLGEICCEVDNNIRHSKCPLKLLSDLLAEERRKVVTEIREEFEPKNATKIDPDKISNEAGLVHFGWSRCKEKLFTKLDQVERGE